MAIVPLETPTAKGTKLSIDINYHPLRKRFSPGIVLKKGAAYSEENKEKKNLFAGIVNEWEWLLLNASQDEVKKVYNLKAGEKTKNEYKAKSVREVLNEVRGVKSTTNPNAPILQNDDVPHSVKATVGVDAKPGLGEVDFFAFWDERHLPSVRNYNNGIYVTIKNRLRKYHNSEGPLPMKDLDKNWAKGWLRYLWTYKEDQKNNTVVLFFNHVRTILDEAVEQEYIPFNPMWLVPKKERPKAKRVDADSLTFEEIQQLMAVKKPRISRQGQLMFLFSCFSGLRISDCLNLKWNQIYTINDKGETKYRIKLQQEKTDGRVNKPLSDSALTILEQRRLDMQESGIKTPFVFPHYCIKRIKKASAGSLINDELKRWGAQAEMEHRMHFHLARHTFATMLLEQGNDITVVQQLLGHKDIRATMIYAHVSTGIKERAVATLPKINQSAIELKKETPKPKKKAKKKPKKK